MPRPVARPAAYGGLLDGALPGGATTAVIADPAWPEGLERELEVLLDALPRAGVPRGRVEVLLAAAADGRAADRALERHLRARLRVPVWAHDPRRSACFTAGRTRAGVAVEVHDELREAEAVVLVGRAAAALSDLDLLVVPGAASERTRLALAPAERAEAAALVPVQFRIGLGAPRDGRWRAIAAGAARARVDEGLRP